MLAEEGFNVVVVHIPDRSPAKRLEDAVPSDAARRDDRRLEQGLRARLHQVIIRNANVR